MMPHRKNPRFLCSVLVFFFVVSHSIASAKSNVLEAHMEDFFSNPQSQAQVFLPPVDGIDPYLGAQSFINSPDVITQIKTLFNNRTTNFYDAMLALGKDQNRIQAVLAEQAMSNRINQFNINAYRQAKLLEGSPWSRDAIISQQLCVSVVLNKTGNAMDRAAANRVCSILGFTGQQATFLKNATGGVKSTESWNTNIAWKILWRKPVFKNHQKLAELAMSVTGTIIPAFMGGKDTINRKVTIIKPLALDGRNGGILGALMYGPTTGTKVYRCNNTKCLVPKLVSMDLSTYSDSFVTKLPFVTHVGTVLNAIENTVNISDCLTRDGHIMLKTETNECFTPQQKQLIESASFPLRKAIYVYGIYGESLGVTPKTYTNIIAFDLAFSYLKKIVDTVIAYAAINQSDSPLVRMYVDNVRNVQTNLDRLYNQKMQFVSGTLDFIKRVQSVQKYLDSAFPGVLQGSSF